MTGNPQTFVGKSQQDVHDPRAAQIEQQAQMLEMMAQSINAPWYVNVPMKALILGLREWAKHPDHNSETPRPAPIPIDKGKTDAPVAAAPAPAPAPEIVGEQHTPPVQVAAPPAPKDVEELPDSPSLANPGSASAATS